MPYSINPKPIPGTGPFGTVPGTVGLPNPSEDLANQLPGLSGINSQISNQIRSKLSGQLSPATLNALQNASATYGAKIGQFGMGPSNSLAYNNLFGNIAGFAEKNAQEGMQDYGSLIPTISGTQTVRPETQIGLAESNAEKLAAPSPAASQLYAQNLFNKYIQGLRSPGGGTRIPPGPTTTHTGGPFGGSGSGGFLDDVAYGNPNATSVSHTGGWQPFTGTPTGTGTGVTPGDWQQMIAQYPQLAGASPEDLAAIGINPWDIGWGGSAPQTGGQPAAGDWSVSGGGGGDSYDPFQEF